MANQKISQLTAVVTPVGTDEYAINQGGVSKRETLTQLLSYVNTNLDADLIPFSSTTGELTALNVGDALRELQDNEAYWTLDGSGFLYYDANPVMIGANIAPDSTLHVWTGSAGAVSAGASYDDFVVENSANVGVQLFSPDANVSSIGFGTPTDPTGAYLQWNYTSQLFTLGSTSTSGEVSIVSGTGTEAVRIDNSQNVGINTSSPSVTLDVQGNSFRYRPTSSTTVGESNFAAPSSNAQLLMRNSAGVANVVITTSGDTKLLGGNVGIGTGSPATLTHLYSGSTPKLRFSDSTTGLSSGFDLSVSADDGYIDGNLTGDIIFRMSGSLTEIFRVTSAGLQLTKSGDSNIYTTDASGMYLDANTAGGMYLQSDGAFYIRGSAGLSYAEILRILPTGEMGLGISTPDGTLHVHTSSAGVVTAHTDANDLVVENIGHTGISLLASDAQRTQIMFGSPSDNLGAFFQWTYDTGLFVIGSSKTGSEITINSGNNVEAIRIDSSQNVGLGTSTPDGTLHVHTASAGTVTAHANADDSVVEGNTNSGISILTPASTAGFVMFGSPNNNDEAYIQYTHGATANTGTFYIISNGTTQAVIDTSGNIGFGISNPDGKLHVHAASAGTVTANAGANNIVVETNGNGGISILTPDASSGQLYIGSPTDNVGALFRWNHDAALNTIGTSLASGEVSIVSGNSVEAIRIDSSQNVNIGSSAGDASALLHLTSTTQGFRPPAMTTTQRDAISTPTAGLQIFNTTDSTTQEYTGSVWQDMGGVSSPWTVSGSDIYYTTGSVWIGTSSGDGTLHVHTNSAGAVSPVTTSDDLIVEGSGSTGISILAPDLSNTEIAFGSPSDNTGGLIQWNYNTGLFQLATSVVGGELVLRSGNFTEAMRVASDQGVYMTGATGGSQGSGTINATGLYINGASVGTAYWTQTGSDIYYNAGKVWIGTTAGGTATCKVRTNGAGSVTPPTYADDLVVENSANGGMSILVPNANVGQIGFGTPGNNFGASIQWSYTSDSFTIGCNTAAGDLVLTTNATTALTIASDHGLYMVGATGGSQGSGTINATAVYDDGSGPLTCYVPHYLVDGALDLADWDDHAPREFHIPARRFLKDVDNRVDVTRFTKFWKKHKHLPTMPSKQEWAAEGRKPMGDLVQRLWETCELQAAHIDQLLSRIEALETYH